MTSALTTERRFNRPTPSLLERAVNLGQAMVDAGRGYIATGQVKASSEIAASRLAICQQCKPWYYAKRELCGHPKCGCYLRVKTHLHAMRCPEGKW